MGFEIKNHESAGGPKPQAGQTVTIHYRGTLNDGSEFDSSYKRNKPFQFKLGVGQVIKGWDAGVAQLGKGDKATLVCEADHAYGEAGIPGVIPGGATLNFDVHLLDFQ